MAKIHNQKKLEDSVVRCDTLAANMLERRSEITTKKIAVLQENEAEVMDYIFGRSDVNPLQEFTDEVNADYDEYTSICAQMTQEVLASTRE